MKIHIVQRNDTFDSIANKYGVSVQDLVGMNTHINHLAGLVPGLKVKVPEVNRKEEANVAQHIQKYYPNLDMNPVDLKAASTIETKPHKLHKPPMVEVEVQEEEVMPIPLKPFPGETVKPTHPNDGVMIKVEKKGIDIHAKATAKVTVNKDGSIKKESGQVVSEQKPVVQMPKYEEYPQAQQLQEIQQLQQIQQIQQIQEMPQMPPIPEWGMQEQEWGQAMEPPYYSGCEMVSYPTYSYPYPMHPAQSYQMHQGCSYHMPPTCCVPYELPPAHEMMRDDERIFVGPAWGWGYPPYWGWGWGGPFWGWGGRPGGRPGGYPGGHHRGSQDVQLSSPMPSSSSCSSLF